MKNINCFKCQKTLIGSQIYTEDKMYDYFCSECFEVHREEKNKMAFKKDQFCQTENLGMLNYIKNT